MLSYLRNAGSFYARADSGKNGTGIAFTCNAVVSFPQKSAVFHSIAGVIGSPAGNHMVHDFVRTKFARVCIKILIRQGFHFVVQCPTTQRATTIP
jgi:hypothetical protein